VLAVTTDAVLAGVGALLAGVGALLSGIAALKMANRKGRESALPPQAALPPTPDP